MKICKPPTDINSLKFRKKFIELFGEELLQEFKNECDKVGPKRFQTISRSYPNKYCISTAFSWEHTTKGGEFWYGINKKWKIFTDKIYINENKKSNPRRSTSQTIIY